MKPSDKEKVIIILCDTLRAKSLSHYGNERNTLPNLESVIEKDFVTYERAYAPAPWTAPSHMSLFTGLYPSQVMETPTSFIINPIFKTLPELFQDSGFSTFVSSANVLISKKLGFDKGVDNFMQCWIPFPAAEELVLKLEGNNKFEKLSRLLGMVLQKEHRSEAIWGVVENLYKTYRGINQDATFSTDRTMKLLKKHIYGNAESKTFSFINLMQTHALYNPPRPTRFKLGTRNREIEDWYSKSTPIDHYAVEKYDDELIEYTKLRYEEEILYLDIVINDLIGFLKSNGMYDNTTIIITSDHGEHFGENGHVAHAFSVFEPLITIPMYIKWSGKEENSVGSSNELVMLQDLYSTFISRLNHWYPAPDSSIDIFSSAKRPWALAQLADMAPNINGCRKKRDSFSISELGLSDNNLSAYIFDNGSKVIENGSEAISYNLLDDPAESRVLQPSDADKELVAGIKREIN